MSAPADLAEKLFRALYADFDLITVDGVYIAVPSDGTVLAFHGSTLAELARQISQSERSTSTMPDPCAAGAGKALDAHACLACGATPGSDRPAAPVLTRPAGDGHAAVRG
jgi:hypothetical protein